MYFGTFVLVKNGGHCRRGRFDCAHSRWRGTSVSVGYMSIVELFGLGGTGKTECRMGGSHPGLNPNAVAVGVTPA